MPGENTPYTQLDANQVLTQSFNEENDSIRVDVGAKVNIDVGQLEITIDKDEDSVTSYQGGTWSVDVSGVATAEKQDEQSLLLSSIDDKLDGPIPVTITTSGTTLNQFDEISAVAQGVLTTISTYTVPLGVQTKLKRISISGTNIAKYEVLIDGNIVDRLYTYFSGSLSGFFDFTDTDLTAGQTVLVRVIHNRPNVGDFNTRIQVVEI